MGARVWFRDYDCIVVTHASTVGLHTVQMLKHIASDQKLDGGKKAWRQGYIVLLAGLSGTAGCARLISMIQQQLWYMYVSWLL